MIRPPAWPTRHRPYRIRERDGGQLTLLVIGYAVIAMLLVTVVVDASKDFLARRSLRSAADGAALAAVQQVDARDLYGVDMNGDLRPVDDAHVRSAVIEFADRHDFADRFRDFDIVDAGVGPDGATVVVTFRCRVRLPFVNVVSSEYADGVTVTVTSRARLPISP